MSAIRLKDRTVLELGDYQVEMDATVFWYVRPTSYSISPGRYWLIYDREMQQEPCWYA
jgi:hypothetical protein